jgi:predicted acyltransferase
MEEIVMVDRGHADGFRTAPVTQSEMASIAAAEDRIARRRAEAAMSRVLAIDLLRGLAVIGMVFVSFAGDWGHRFAVLTHVDWRGFAPAEMVFPFFLFCVGAVLPYSLARRAAEGREVLLGHVVRRSAALFALGVVLNALPGVDLAHVRLMGILQRIGLCYAVVGTACVLLGREGAGGFTIDPKPFAAASLLILVGYGALLLNWDAPDCGQACFDSAHSLPAVVDRAMFGTAHLWRGGTTNGVVTFDPEGLVSTLGALFNVVLGVLAALTLQRHGARNALIVLTAVGAFCLVFGLALDFYVPVVKKIWTPTYAMMSGGFSLLAFVALALAAPPHGAAWTRPLQVYGSNAMLAFVGVTVLDTFMQLQLAGPGQNLRDALVAQLGRAIPDAQLASAAYSAILLLVLGVGLWQLYRRRVFVKL